MTNDGGEEAKPAAKEGSNETDSMDAEDPSGMQQEEDVSQKPTTSEQKNTTDHGVPEKPASRSSPQKEGADMQEDDGKKPSSPDEPAASIMTETMDVQEEAEPAKDLLECSEKLSEASADPDKDEEAQPMHADKVTSDSIGPPPPPSPAVTRKRPRTQRQPLPTASSRKMTTRGRRLTLKADDDDMSDDYDEDVESPSKKRGKRRQQEESDSDSYEDETFLSTSANLSYSWGALRLGEELGSAALNRFMARYHPTGDSPQLTAQQTLQIVNTLRLKTIVPPAESPLHRIIQTNRFENQALLYGPDDEEAEYEAFYSPEATTVDTKTLPYLTASDEEEGKSDSGKKPLPPLMPRPARIPYKAFARLYESMCEQDVDDGAANRREVQYLTTTACVERLKSLENQACALKLREEQIMEKAKELDLIDAQDVSSLLGYRLPEEETAEGKVSHRFNI